MRADNAMVDLVRRKGMPVLVGALVVLIEDCFNVNDNHVCSDVSPSVSRVNEAGDGEEFIGHTQAAARIAEDRVLVVFNGQSIETDGVGKPLTSEARMALLDTAGQVKTACGSGNREARISAAGNYAYGSSVAPAPLDIAGRRAAALVQWKVADDALIHFRFVDEAACPLASEFHLTEGGDYSASLAWSEARGAVLLVLLHDREVRSALISAAEPTVTQTVARARSEFSALPHVVLATDGRALVTWAESGRGPSAVLLDVDGAALTDPFDLGFPNEHGVSNAQVVSAVVADDRFAIAAEAQSANDSARSVYLREFSMDGLPLGAPWRIADATHAQASPVPVFIEPDALMVTWLTRTTANGRVLGHRGAARFNTLSCGNDTFKLLPQTKMPMGSMTALVVNQDVWILSAANLSSDPRGNGVGLWKLPFHTLYPTRFD